MTDTRDLAREQGLVRSRLLVFLRPVLASEAWGGKFMVTTAVNSVLPQETISVMVSFVRDHQAHSSLTDVEVTKILVSHVRDHITDIPVSDISVNGVHREVDADNAESVDDNEGGGT